MNPTLRNRPLEWQDLSDNQDRGLEVLAELFGHNCRTVQALKALLASPDGQMAFQEVFGLDPRIMKEHLDTRHPDIETLPPMEKIPGMGFEPELMPDSEEE